MHDHTWGTVAIRAAGAVRRLRLTRPAERNAISKQMGEELLLALETLTADADARVVVLEGEGRSFCAGADIAEMRASGSATFAQNLADAERLAEVFRTLDALPRPTIARIHGHCLGGGVGLIACCDVAIASEETVFAFSETRLGIVPAVISPYSLRRIGPSHARRYFLSGERFDAVEARRIGLISQSCGIEELDGAVVQVVEEMLAAGPEAQARIKRMIRESANQTWEEYRRSTPQQIAEARQSEEGQAGLSAFRDKVPPPWVPRPEPLTPGDSR
ncbi:MAG: enoyl-CoA hydratase-related protein [Candidatus Eiseniibacteriota bacterium]